MQWDAIKWDGMNILLHMIPFSYKLMRDWCEWMNDIKADLQMNWIYSDFKSLVWFEQKQKEDKK